MYTCGINDSKYRKQSSPSRRPVDDARVNFCYHQSSIHESSVVEEHEILYF